MYSTLRVIRKKRNYIHRDPVVAGIVELPEHYLILYLHLAV